MLDSDLAELYGVETKQLNRAVTRHISRFPADFMFRLSKEEFHVLRCQSGTSSSWGGRRHPPRVFTEQGVAMLSSVLRSPQAIDVNVEIVRAFVRLREILATHKALARKLAKLEKQYDRQFQIVFEVIQNWQPPTDKPQIGFRSRGAPRR